MEEKVSEILENLLGLLGLEGSFEIEERDDGVFISIEAEDPGILIWRGGETLASLQLILNLIASRQIPQEENKRIIVDVSSWRKGKEEELGSKSNSWIAKVLETKQPLELEPMPAWQRRIVHMSVEQAQGVKSESTGEGAERRLIISPSEEETKT